MLISCEFFVVLFRHSVDDNLRVAVSDDSLARDLFDQDYHYVGEGQLPVKWMAPEAIVQTRFIGAAAADMVKKEHFLNNDFFLLLDTND